MYFDEIEREALATKSPEALERLWDYYESNPVGNWNGEGYFGTYHGMFYTLIPTVDGYTGEITGIGIIMCGKCEGLSAPRFGEKYIVV